MRPAIATMNAYDAFLSPTLASPPVPVGYFDEVDPAENFERQKRFTPYTALYNISGQPAVSLPLYWNCGRAADRRHARRAAGGRGHADLAVFSDRGGEAVAGSASPDLVSVCCGDPAPVFGKA